MKKHPELHHWTEQMLMPVGSDRLARRFERAELPQAAVYQLNIDTGITEDPRENVKKKEGITLPSLFPGRARKLDDDPFVKRLSRLQ